MNRITLVAMNGLRVGHQRVLDAGMRLPGLRRRAAALDQLPPLGLLTLASVIPNEWETTWIEDDGKRPTKQLTEQVLNSSPNLVAFSALTASADRAAEVSRQIRAREVPTVIGGLHATALPTWCQQHFTSVVSGDGEPIFANVLDDCRTRQLKPVYRAQTHFDISRSPLPAWHLRDGEPSRFTLQTSRGCPWACSFCAASRLLGPGRVKSLGAIEQELQTITKLRKRPWLELADDNTFAFDRDHFGLLDLLQSSGARWFTESDWRIANNPKLLEKIAASGCQQILVGVESSVFRYPGMGKKSAEMAEIVEAIVHIQSKGIVVNACFIVGADGETGASIDRLAEFLLDAPFGELQLTLQTPFPGTRLYNQLHSENRLLYNDFSRFTLFDVVYQPDRLSPEQLQERFMHLVETVFSPPQQIRRDGIRKRIRRQRTKA